MNADGHESTTDTDHPRSAVGTLPPRAAVAMLTLRARAAEQDARRAEQDEAAVDHEAALRELRGRLDTMVRERTRIHAAAIASARERATNDIDAARRTADAIAAQRASARSTSSVVTVADVVDTADAGSVSASVAHADLDLRPAPVNGTPTADLSTSAPLSASPTSGGPSTTTATTAHDVAGPSVDSSSTPAPAPGPSSASASATGSATTSRGASAAGATGASSNGANDALFDGTPLEGHERIGISAGLGGAPQVVVDAEVLGRVFASLFSSMLDERLAAWAKAAAGPQALAAAPVSPAAPQKSSFWRALRHPDVALLAIATVIAVVVLASWMG